MSDRVRAESIKQAIWDAFALVPYPGDDALALHPEDDKGKSILLHLTGRRWRDALDQVAEWLDDKAVLFLTPAARHHYLPAFLFASLNGYTDVRRWLLHALEPPDSMARFRREFDAYTPEQKEAVRRFLEFVCDEAKNRDDRTTARTALDRYWMGDPPRETSPASVTTGEGIGKERVKQALREAFADVPYPGDRAIAYNPDAWEADELDMDLRGYHWRELPRGIVLCHIRDLVYFSERGLQFYLPAYLLASLDDDGDLVDSVMYHLSGTGDVDKLKRKHALFTPAQKSAVRLFLEYVRDHIKERDMAYDTRIALDLYWANDAPGEPRPPVDPARKEQVKQAILDAFADAPYPGDEAIAQEDTKVREDFKGMHFRDVPREVLIRHHSFLLGKFSAAGLHFYLPAYLLAALDEVFDIIYWVVDLLESMSTYPDSPRNPVRLFSLPQKQAVRAFLLYVREAMPHLSLAGFAEKALEQGWDAAAAGR